ncbi:MAG: hypothetical protein WCG97_03720 [bacterium]
MSNCLTTNVTENDLKSSQVEAVQFGCLRITVTENNTKLWSITFKGVEGMDAVLRDELIYNCATEYQALGSKKTRGSYLDFFLEKIAPLVFPLKSKKMNRKSVIRCLNQSLKKIPRAAAGRRKFYTDIDNQTLRMIWPIMGYMCGKRLKPALKEWIIFFDLSEEIKKKILRMSAATIDRVLEPARAQIRRMNNTSTVPIKFHIKQKIPLRDKSIKVEKIGHIETDTVVHCGDHIWGTFGNTSTTTELLSGWTEARVTYGKNAELVIKTIEEMELILPVTMTNLYFDNGTEYINHALVKAFAERTDKPVVVARGRSGRSNDQCHVEQKNNVFVRELFGYDRVESLEIIDLMNDLYKNEWSLLFNYFYPQMKLIEKDRVGSKCRRKYDVAKTPYQRLIECGQLTLEQEKKLRDTKLKLNPVELQQAIQKKLSRIVNLIKKQDSYKGAL